MFCRRIFVNAERARLDVVLLFKIAVGFDRAHKAAATPLVPTDHVGHAVVLRAVLHEFFHLRSVIERIRRSDNLCTRIHLADQIVSLFPETRIEIDARFPGVVRFVPNFVTVKVLVARRKLIVDNGLYFVFPVVHVLEFVGPARQNVGQANLDLGSDTFDTRSYQKGTTNALLATATAARRRKEHVRLERGNIFFDVARKRLGKAIKRTRRYMSHRLDAIAQAYVQVYRGKQARRQENQRENFPKSHIITIPCAQRHILHI